MVAQVKTLFSFTWVKSKILFSISISIKWEICHLLDGAKEGAVLQEHIAFVHRFVTKPLIKGSLDLFYEEARWYQV